MIVDTRKNSIVVVDPDDTRIYCGHEYTLENLKFSLAVEPDNKDIKLYQEKAFRLRKGGQSTLPSLLSQEKKVNPFLRISEPSIISSVRKKTGKLLNDPEEIFAALRQWKNEFK